MVKRRIERAELSPDVLVKHIRKRNEELEKFLTEKEKTLKDPPEGKLRFVKKGKSIQYHHQQENSVTKGSYLKRAQNSFASALAQKEYDFRLIRELKAEIKILGKTLASYRPDRIDLLYSSLHPCRKPLVHPAILPDNEYVKRWMSVEYVKKGFEENTPDFSTAKGERVRSESEILIADALNRRNIPYRYEYPILIPGIGTVHPDFTCLNVRTRKEYVWEHNGMMSDSEYADYAIKKIETYTLAGYCPGENLILTFESDSRPLSSRMIESNINKYLI